MNKLLLSIIITVISGIIIAATSWNFLATADVPKKFVSKKDFQYFLEKNERNNNKMLELIGKQNIKLDRIVEILLQHSIEEGE